MIIEGQNHFRCTLIGEARNQPIEGIIGVGFVIDNRMRASNKSYKDICLAPLQFSCWNSNDPNYGLITNLLSKLDTGEQIYEHHYRQCIAVADCIINGDFIDNVHGAKNYVTLDRYAEAKKLQRKQDTWIVNMKPVITLGQHIFLVD